MSKSGLLKSGWVMMNPVDTRIIDSNALAEMKLKELSMKVAAELNEDINFTDDFSQGIDAAQVEELVGEENLDEETPTPSPAEEAMQQATEEIEMMKQQAMAEIEQARQALFEEAKQTGYQQGFEEGKREGYQQGHQEGVDSVNQAREQLFAEAAEKIARIELEYKSKVDELEPKFIDTLTGIYEHIFQVSLKNSRDLVVHLVGNTMKNLEGNNGYLVHVSKEDYPFVSMQKKEIVKGTSIQIDSLDIIEDATLQKSECMIETGNGVFDCSLGTQLEALREELKLLSYEPIQKEK